MVNLNTFDFFDLYEAQTIEEDKVLKVYRPTDFIGSFLVSQFTTLPYPSHYFSGQIIIVTGANVGLGFEAAKHFVRLNAAKVILGCRNIERGGAAKHEIEELLRRPGIVEVWPVDLSSYESIKEFCARANKLERLDAVVENAGLATPKYKEVEGMESTITVNVISTFLMALLLLPKLRESAVKFNIVPHLTVVASDAHEQVLLLTLQSHR
jgi:retinol dehydrogenase-12